VRASVPKLEARLVQRVQVLRVQQVRLVQLAQALLALRVQVQKLFVQLSELVVFRPWALMLLALMLLALALMQRSKLHPLVDKI
jgi:hypothetical protein